MPKKAVCDLLKIPQNITSSVKRYRVLLIGDVL